MAENTFKPFNLGIKTVCQSLDFKVFDGYMRLNHTRNAFNHMDIIFSAIDDNNEKYTILPFIYDKEKNKLYKKDNPEQDLTYEDFYWCTYNGSYPNKTTTKKREFKNETERMLFKYIFGSIVERSKKINYVLRKIKRSRKNLADSDLEGFPHEFRKKVIEGYCISSPDKYYKCFFKMEIKPENCGLQPYVEKRKKAEAYNHDSSVLSYSISPHPTLDNKTTGTFYDKIIKLL